MKKSKIEFYIGMNVAGNVDDFSEIESKFGKIAKKYNGYIGGAGYGGKGRDLSVYFPSDTDATRFRNHVKKIKGVSKEFYYSLMYDNPNTKCYESMEIDI